MVIHKGTYVYKTWLSNQQGALIAATTNGYITKIKFHEYAIRFVLSLKRNRLLDQPHLLLIDSHKSCRQLSIFAPHVEQQHPCDGYSTTLLPHCSALDNCPFSHFRCCWEKHLDNWNFN